MRKYFNIFAFSLLISVYSLLGFSQYNINFLNEKPKLIIISADWCNPCKIMNTWMEEDENIKQSLLSYDIYNYDFDIDKKQIIKYNIKVVPTLIVVKKEVEVARRVGITNGKKGLELFLITNK